MTTFVKNMNKALSELLKNKDVLVGGQLIRYGVAGITTGLFKKRKY